MTERTTSPYRAAARGSGRSKRLRRGRGRHRHPAAAPRLAPHTPLSPVTIANAHADVAIVLAAPKSSIAGLVVDETGAPIADVAVRVRAEAASGAPIAFEPTSRQAVALTDANGHFSIDRLADGNYAVLATARDGSERRMEPVAAGTQD